MVRWWHFICISSGMFSEGVTEGTGSLKPTSLGCELTNGSDQSAQKLPLPNHTNYLMIARGGGDLAGKSCTQWADVHPNNSGTSCPSVWPLVLGGVQSGVMCTTPPGHELRSSVFSPGWGNQNQRLTPAPNGLTVLKRGEPAMRFLRRRDASRNVKGKKKTKPQKNNQKTQEARASHGSLRLSVFSSHVVNNQQMLFAEIQQSFLAPGVPKQTGAAASRYKWACSVCRHGHLWDAAYLYLKCCRSKSSRFRRRIKSMVGGI